MAESEGLESASVETLLRIVRSPSASDDLLCDAAHWLIEHGDKRAIQPLERRLVEFRDLPWVRSELVTALGSIMLISDADSVTARDLFLEILTSSEDDRVRSAAALNLGSLGETRAVEPLLEILESGEAKMLIACVGALGELGDPRSLDALIESLESDELFVPQIAAQALAKLGAAGERALHPLQRLAERGNEAEARFAREAIARIESELERGSDTEA